MSARDVVPNSAKSEICIDAGKLQRLKYFYGQMLGVQDFQTEQDYFRDKLKLHNRCLHGYGVVCGLLVEPVPIPKDCTAEEEAEEKKIWDELQALLQHKAAAQTAPAPEAPNAGTEEAPAAPAESRDAQIEALRRRLGDFYKEHCREHPRTCVKIRCGLALDCDGNELVLRQPRLVDLLAQMSDDDHRRVKHGAEAIYVSICYCEQSVDPVRPILPEICGAAPGCEYARLQEGIRVQVSVDPPCPDTRCDTCCHPCPECCLLLARIDDFCPGHPLRQEQIHNEVRRPLLADTYFPTTITGISWKNGHYYTQEQAMQLMGTRDRLDDHEHEGHRTKGLNIHFSRPVLASTIHPGVMDTWVICGGRGRRADIYSKSGEFVDKPKDGTVKHIFFRDTSGEILEPGDRVLVTLRTSFILDECCRPVAGTNVGGRVPVIKEYAERYHLHPHPEECSIPPLGYGPWTSGEGIVGGVFESWFFIRQGEEEHGRRREGHR